MTAILQLSTARVVNTKTFYLNGAKYVKSWLENVSKPILFSFIIIILIIIIIILFFIRSPEPKAHKVSLYM